ncbi:AAA family ATPase [Streptomyces sp. AV19]|uniref:AAA family ATPase n=1 Tax=Streptomyces sp. AV19 TaxID=2793068 RepID=UPI0035AB7EE9
MAGERPVDVYEDSPEGEGPVVYLLVGLTGAGKTTYARRKLEPAGVVRLSVDETVAHDHGRYGVDYPQTPDGLDFAPGSRSRPDSRARIQGLGVKAWVSKLCPGPGFQGLGFKARGAHFSPSGGCPLRGA